MTDQNTSVDVVSAIDQRLQAAVEYANFSSTLFNQKKNLKLRCDNSLTYSIGGGTFAIDRELISFTAVLLIKGKTSAVLLDANSNPVLIEKLQEFNDTITDIYYESLNQYLVDVNALKKSRTTKALVGE